MTGLAEPPIYYSATPPPGGNLLTNTSISFLGSSWLTSGDLYDILGTPDVAGSIAQGLAALGEALLCFQLWSVHARLGVGCQAVGMCCALRALALELLPSSCLLHQTPAFAHPNVPDYGEVTVWMLPPSQPGSSSSLSAGAVAGISIGIVAVLVAAAGALFAWRRKRRIRQEGTALGKAQAAEEGLGVAAMAGGSGSPPMPSKLGSPPGSPAAVAPLAYSHALQQGQAGKKDGGRPDAALLWGSAQQYSNGLLPSLSARSTAAASAVSFATSAAAPSSHLSRGASANESQLAGPTSSDLQRLRDDPLLEWILKSQQPPTAEEAASAAAVAATAAATAAAHSQASRDGRATGNHGSSTPLADASEAAGSMQQQQRRGSSANPLMDVRVWQFSFRELEIQRQIGAGSFGRVSCCAVPARPCSKVCFYI